MQPVQQLFDTADRKRRDDQFAALRHRLLHHRGERRAIVFRRMETIAVGGFEQQHVGLNRRRGIRQNRPAVATQVATKQHTPARGASAGRKHERRAEQVSGVNELDIQVVADLHLGVERARLEPRQRRGGIDLGVQRQRRVVLREAMLVGMAGVLFLDVRRIRKN